jgi:sugar phosphate isomerase/epimerase
MMNRREGIRLMALGGGAVFATNPFTAKKPVSRGKRMGVVVYSYHLRRSNGNLSNRYPPFEDTVELLEHCHAIGAGGLQAGISGWSEAFAREVRDKRESLGLFLEGQIALPKELGDLSVFEKEISRAREAGATVLRVAVGGRRYEQFDSYDGWKAMKEQAWKSFRLAEPIAAKHRVKLAVENHKDWRIDDLVEFVEGIGSEWFGICLDTGNSIALLEDPMETARALAPSVLTTHVKDMGVKEYSDGFLLSEVPLGRGFLDLPGIFDLCEKANPQVQFCLEMITRDPLKIPCLTQNYWATFSDAKARRLASALQMARSNASEQPLPRISNRSNDGQLELEEHNIRLCLKYAEQELGLAG